MDKRRIIIGSVILAAGIAWTINGAAHLDGSADIFTDNTLGLGIATMVMSVFVFKRLRSNRHKTLR